MDGVCHRRLAPVTSAVGMQGGTVVCGHGGAYDIGWSDNHAAITFDNPFKTPQCGGLMEAFMIRTGFYDKVTAIEAERLEETREEREEFLRNLRKEVERQAAQKHVVVHLPPEKP